MYTTIVFDFFDVIRSDPYKAWLQQHGIERTGPFAEASKPLDRGEITPEEFFEVLHRLSGHPTETIARHYDNTTLMHEDMPKLIEKLKEQYKVGLLSNAHKDYLRPLLEAHDHEKLFDVVVISGETGLIKPTPEAFHHILEKMQAKPQEVIFIDDNAHNVVAAEELGLKGLLFTDYHQLRKDLDQLRIAV